MPAKVVSNNTGFIKHLTYRRELRMLARFLNLSKILRKLYYYWSRPRDGILIKEVGGISGRFFINTPGELRVVESMGVGEVENSAVCGKVGSCGV